MNSKSHCSKLTAYAQHKFLAIAYNNGMVSCIKFYQYLSIKAPVCQWVSLSVCLFVCFCPNSSETTEPDELKFWGMIPLWDGEGFRLKNIRIRRTVSRKIACIVVRKIACILAILAVNFILSSMNLQRIWEVGRGWGD